jgi:hypothetical protein
VSRRMKILTEAPALMSPLLKTALFLSTHRLDNSTPASDSLSPFSVAGSILPVFAGKWRSSLIVG